MDVSGVQGTCATLVFKVNNTAEDRGRAVQSGNKDAL